mmetsp:Transcript_84/g.252  ORF Transcript_84/g.252 Transcript_84/m.252 type:complete len:203 (-) Transcript_84:1084-1692(-)
MRCASSAPRSWRPATLTAASTATSRGRRSVGAGTSRRTRASCAGRACARSPRGPTRASGRLPTTSMASAASWGHSLGRRWPRGCAIGACWWPSVATPRRPRRTSITAAAAGLTIWATTARSSSILASVRRQTTSWSRWACRAATACAATFARPGKGAEARERSATSSVLRSTSGVLRCRCGTPASKARWRRACRSTRSATSE